jgi:CHAT domain-containing protein/Flp pilus assembly protein TadD
MIRPHSRSIQCNYRSWLFYCGLVLSVSLPLVQIRSSADPLYSRKEVQPYADLVSPAQENQSPQQLGQLELGKPVERELTGGQSHSYQITTAAGQYVRFVVDQRGIDVAVKLFRQDGKQIIEFDSETRPQEQETVEWVAEEAGSYRLDVVVNQKDAPSGRYEIQVVELRPATENDRALHKAGKLYTESRKLYIAGKYDEAHPLAEHSLEIREKLLGPEHPDVARTINHLAILNHVKGDYARAELLFQRALTIREKVLGPEHPDVAASFNNLAEVYRQRGKYAKAEPLFRSAQAIWEKALGPEHPLVAASLNNLAIFYKTLGENTKAEPLLLRALAIRERALGPEHPETAISLGNLATFYSNRGDYAKAETLLQRALAIREKVLGPEHPDVATSLNSLAILYKARGNHTKAEPFYRRALAIREKVLGREHSDVAVSHNNLAIFYSERGDYAKAEMLLQHALTIWETVLGREHLHVARALTSLANLYRNRGDYAKAELFYQRALTITKKAVRPEHPLVATCLNNLAILYYERGDYVKAEPLYQSALAMQEQSLGPRHKDVGRSLDNLATLYRKRGDYAKAEPLYQSALAIAENSVGPEHPDSAAVLHNLAVLYSAKGDIARAVTFQSRASTIYERNFALNLAIGSERQKLAYLALLSKGTDFSLSLHSQAVPNDPQALDLAFTTLLRRKARGLDAMTDTIATLRRQAEPEDQALFDKLADARSHLASFTLKETDAAKPDTYRTRIDTLKEKVENLEAELSSRSAEFRAQTQPITIAAVQAALPADSALIEFAYLTPLDAQTEKRKPPRYLAYLLAAQGQPKWVDLGEAAPIDQSIETWRKALRDPTRADVKRLARAVDEKVMRPVRSFLREMPGEARRLLIAPDGSLNLIPFAALVDERNQYLIERYSISYLTSGRDLLRLQTTQPSNAPPLLVANPDFGRFATIAMRGGRSSGKLPTRNRTRGQIDPTQLFFQPLPATEDEALAIKALLPKATVLRREEATETALKQVNRPQILHIATHGFFLNHQDPTPANGDQMDIPSSATTRPASVQATSYTVQMGASPLLGPAQEKARVLRTQGVDAYIVKSNVKDKGTFFRVRAGKFPSIAEAQNYGDALQAKGAISEFFVARYGPAQEDMIERAPTISGAPAKPANSTPVTAPPANSQPVTEPPSGLRLSMFVAQVKDPLLRSGLALAGANHGKSGDDDGILTALEAAYLNLLGTKLVVLSACDTGVGEVKNGEGVQGLRRALVLAGSESQVMSLWPVSDETTKDMMIPYYKALQQGEGRGEGLRQVQLRMLRGRKDRRHPFYWAAFIQSGEWVNLDGQR